MRQVEAAVDPDGRPRLVTLPATWDDAAAEALVRLSPGDGPVSLAAASAIWLGVIGQRARQEGWHCTDCSAGARPPRMKQFGMDKARPPVSC